MRRMSGEGIGFGGRSELVEKAAGVNREVKSLSEEVVNDASYSISRSAMRKAIQTAEKRTEGDGVSELPPNVAMRSPEASVSSAVLPAGIREVSSIHSGTEGAGETAPRTLKLVVTSSPLSTFALILLGSPLSAT